MTTRFGAPRQPAKPRLLFGGKDLGSIRGMVRELTVQLERNVSGTATLVFDSFRDERGRWSVQDSGMISPWQEVQIDVCFDGSTEPLFHGYVREVRLNYPEDMSAACVTVILQDDLLKLDREQEHRVISALGSERADGDVVREYASKYQLKVQAEDGLRAGALQINSTPIKFLRDRAEANGFELFVRDKVLHFHPPLLLEEPQPPILVYAGARTNCLKFSSQHDGHRPDKVQVRFPAVGSSPPRVVVYEPKQHSFGEHPLMGDGAGLRPFIWTLEQPSGATEAELASRATAKANENQFKITAEGLLDGTQYGHVLASQYPVRVDGVGITYGGLYYVTAVTHKFTGGRYEQHFKLIGNATN